MLMVKKDINRLRVVLAERRISKKWLADKMQKNPTTVSRWCSNEMQPSLETLLDIAEVLEVDIKDLIWSSIKISG